MYQGTILEILNMGGGEIALIMVAILLLFGGKKLPELARGLGKGIREFKDASEDVKREIHRNINSVTTEEEEKQEELNHSTYHHPTEDQEMLAQADTEFARSGIDEQEAEPPVVINEEPLEAEEQAPVKGKESHIE
ncbi:Sec-independent protein translocase subunit TatA/TatB [Pedobacter insulae]|uniref:Sec-independent protein translocase protein TatA n=1 Tax=Pedobacter insulae TaxID=414048 RepID=A0A1I2YY93_9SPHI|nr:twin-arginine translocase TatA/TatE family subunit [Pedobacter insulae]SFH30430.1 twin arginine-targeting protein translocase, TatA/E family [Pedobacter insulae]